MSHTYMKLPKGWSVEFLRDDSDYFVELLTQFTDKVKKLVNHPPVHLNTKLSERSMDYMSNTIDKVLKESKERIRTDKDLQGCTFVKYVKESNKFRAEIRMEESRHDKIIEVEALVYKIDSECNDGCNRTNIYFWEEDYSIKEDETSNAFKARAADDVQSQIELIDIILRNNSPKTNK